MSQLFDLTVQNLLAPTANITSLTGLQTLTGQTGTFVTGNLSFLNANAANLQSLTAQGVSMTNSNILVGNIQTLVGQSATFANANLSQLTGQTCTFVTGNMSQLNAQQGNVQALQSQSASFVNSVITLGNIQSLVGQTAAFAVSNVVNLSAGTANVSALAVANLNVQSLVCNVSQTVTSNAQSLTATNANIISLSVQQGNVQNLVSQNGNINVLVAGNANVTNLVVQQANVTSLVAQTAQMMSSNVASLTVAYANLTNTVIQQANVQTLTAVSANVQNLYGQTAVFSTVTTTSNTGTLTAAIGNLSVLNTQFANIQTLLAQTASFTSITSVGNSGIITSAIGNLANLNTATANIGALYAQTSTLGNVQGPLTVAGDVIFTGNLRQIMFGNAPGTGYTNYTFGNLAASNISATFANVSSVIGNSVVFAYGNISSLTSSTANVSALNAASRALTSYPVTLGTAVGSWTQVCNVSDPQTAGTFIIRVSLVQSRGYNGIQKSYNIPMNFTYLPSTWVRCIPEYNLGPNNGNDFALDIISPGSGSITLRVVRTSSGNFPNTGLTAGVFVAYDGTYPITVAYDGTSGTAATVSGIYTGSPLGTTTGNVGILTATPAYPLDVAGSSRVTGTLLPGTVSMANSSVINFGYDQTKEANAGKIGYGNMSAGSTLDVVGVGSTVGQRKVQAFDMLGVGTVPSYPVDVAGNIRVQQQVGGSVRPSGLRLENTSTSGVGGMTVDFASQLSAVTQPQKVCAQIVGEPDNVSGGRLLLLTANVAGNLNQAVGIYEKGQVGIGTVSPGALLDVAGNVRAQTSFTTPLANVTTLGVGNVSAHAIVGTANNVVQLINTGSGAGTATGVSFQTSGGRGAPSAAVNAVDDGSNSSHLTFATSVPASGAAPTERVRITAAGNVGVNTSNPLFSTHVLPSVTDFPAINPDATNTLMVYEDCLGATLASGTLYNSASFDAANDYVVLTPSAVGQNGQLNYNINPGSAFDATFEFFVGTSGGSWTEGICFTCYNNNSYGGIIDIYQAAQKATGYCLTLIDSNTGSGGAKSVSLFWNATLLTSVTSTAFQLPLNAWTQVRINFVRNVWRVWVGSTQVINYQDVSRTLVGPNTYNMGFNGQCGAAGGLHLIRNIQITKHTQGPWRPAAGGNVPGIQYAGPVGVTGNLVVAGNLAVLAGNVGINTSNPQAALDVAGNARIQANLFAQNAVFGNAFVYGPIQTTTAVVGGDLINKQYGSAGGDRFGVGVYNGATTRTFTSGFAGGGVAMSVATDNNTTQTGAFTDMLYASNTSISLNRPAVAAIGNAMLLPNNSTIGFGYDVAGKELNAGRVGYGTYSSGAALDVVGAGAVNGQRKLQLLDWVGVSGVPTMPLDVYGSMRSVTSNAAVTTQVVSNVAGLSLIQTGTGLNGPVLSLQGTGGVGAPVAINFGTFPGRPAPSATITATDDGSNSSPLIFGVAATGSSTASATERMRLTQTGFMGIGTPTPATVLDVAGNTRLQQQTFIGINTPTDTSQGQFAGIVNRVANVSWALPQQSTLVQTTQNVQSQYFLNTDYNYPSQPGAPSGRLQVNDSNFSTDWRWHTKAPGLATNPLVERLTIAAGGNVGVNQSAPQFNLDVGGSLRALTANVGTLTVSNLVGYSSVANVTDIAGNSTSYTYGNVVNLNVGTGTSTSTTGSINASGSVSFYAANSSGVNNQLNFSVGGLSMLQSGGLGGGFGPVLYLRGTGGGASTTTGLTMATFGRAQPSVSITAGDDSLGSGPLMFSAAPTGSSTTTPTERMRLQPGGQLGIGTMTPQNLLDVAGNARIQLQLTGNVANLQALGVTSGNIATLGATSIYGNVANLQVLGVTSGNIATLGATSIYGNVANLQALGVTSGNIATLGATSIYGNVANLQVLGVTSGNIATLGATSIYGNVANLQALGVTNGNIATLGATTIFCSNIQGYAPPVANFQNISGTSSSYLTSNAGNLLFLVAQGGSLSASNVTVNGPTQFMGPVATFANINLSGTNCLSLGYDVPGRDPAAGKMGYGTFSGGAGLDIVGAGAAGSTRLVKLYDSLIVPNANIGTYVSTLYVAAGSNQNHFLQGNGYTNLFVGGSQQAANSCFMTWNNTQAPGAAGSMGLGVYGVPGGITVSPTGNVGISQINPQAALDVVGNTRIAGNVNASAASISGPLTVTGNVNAAGQLIAPVANVGTLTAGASLRATFPINLSTTSAAYTQICTISDPQQSAATYMISIVLVQSRGYNAILKTYNIPMTYSYLPVGWMRVNPMYNTGANNGNDFALDITSTGATVILRAVRLTGTNFPLAGLTAYVSVVYDNAYQLALNYDGTTGTGATNTGLYSGSPLGVAIGNVGIMTANPAYPLDVAGSARFQGSLFASQVGVGTTNPVTMVDIAGNARVQGNLAVTNVNVIGVNVVNFGSDQTKEPNAGKIGYGTLSGNTLDVVGAGTVQGQRKVTMYDNLIMYTANGSGNISAGSMSASSLALNTVYNPAYPLDIGGACRIQGALYCSNVVGYTPTVQDISGNSFNYVYGNAVNLTTMNANVGTAAAQGNVNIFGPTSILIANSSVNHLISASAAGLSLIQSGGPGGGFGPVLFLRGTGGGATTTTGITMATFGRAFPSVAITAGDDSLGSGPLMFSTAPTGSSATAPTEKMRLQPGGQLGIGMSNPVNLLDVSGNCRIIGTTTFGGNVNVVGNVSALSNVSVSGSLTASAANVSTLTAGASLRATFPINLAITPGAYTQICTVLDPQQTAATYMIRVSLVQSRGYNAILKTYNIPMTYTYLTNSWVRVNPEYNLGPGNNNDFALDLYGNGSTSLVTLRAVRLSNSGGTSLTGITAFVSVVYDNAYQLTLNYDGTSGTGATNTGLYAGSPIGVTQGNVGVLTATPAYPLDVGGSCRIQGALFCSNIVGYSASGGVANVVDIAGNSFNYVIGNVASLGVGTGTPAMSLDVVGNTRVQRLATGAYRPAGLRLENTSTTAPIGLTMDFATQFSGLAQPQKVAAQIVGEPDSGTGGRIGFSTANTTGVLNQTLSINASGVTTAPQFAATSANIVSLGAGTIYCSNIVGYSASGGVANVQDISGNSFNYTYGNAINLATGNCRILGTMQVLGQNVVNFGADATGKELNAGKIGYGTFSSGTGLDIVGAGTVNGQRRVIMYDSLVMNTGAPGAGNISAYTGSFTGNLNAAAGAFTGNLSGNSFQGTSLALNQPNPSYTLDVVGTVRANTNTVFQQNNAYTNLLLGNSFNTGQCGFVNYNSVGQGPPPPGAPGSVGIGIYGVGAGITIGPTGNVGVNQTNPQAALDVVGTTKVSGNVNAAAASFAGPVTALNATITGQQSFFQYGGQNCNLFLGNALATNQCGFMTYNSQYAPGAAGSIGIGIYNVPSGITVSPTGNVGINQTAPQFAMHVQPSNTDVPAINPDATNTLMVYEDCKQTTVSAGATLVGGAFLNTTQGGFVQLTTPGTNASGAINYSINPGTAFDLTSDIYVQPGTTPPADSIYFYCYCSTSMPGYAGTGSGYTVVFDEFGQSGTNGAYPYTIALYYGSTLLASQTSSTVTIPLNAWTQVRMTFVRNVWKVWLGSTLVINYQDISRTLSGPGTNNMGWGGAYGASTAYHSVRQIQISKYAQGPWRPLSSGNSALTLPGIQYNGPITVTGNITTQVVQSANAAGDMISRTFTSSTDRYGVGAYNPGVTRLFSSGTIPSTVNLSLATDGNVAFQDLLVASNTLVNVNRPAIFTGNASVQGALNLNGPVSMPANNLGDWMSAQYSVMADRYGIGQYNNGAMRLFTSGTSTTAQISLCTANFLSGGSFTDILIAAYNGITMRQPVSITYGNLTLTTSQINLTNTNSICFGTDVSGKEPNAGKIGYGTFSGGAGGTLDIVGAGSFNGQRRVQIYDNLLVNGGNISATTGNINAAAASFSGPLTAFNATITGQQSFFQSTGYNCNLFLGNALSQNQCGFMTYNSQYNPGAPGSVGIGVYGVSPGITVSPTGNVGINQVNPAAALDVYGQSRIIGSLTVNGSNGNGVQLYGNAGTYYAAIGGAGNCGFQMQSYAGRGGGPTSAIVNVDDSLYSGNMCFHTANPGSPGNILSEKMRLTSSGCVGIANSNPVYPLSVGGIAQFSQQVIQSLPVQTRFTMSSASPSTSGASAISWSASQFTLNTTGTINSLGNIVSSSSTNPASTGSPSPLVTLPYAGIWTLILTVRFNNNTTNGENSIWFAPYVSTAYGETNANGNQTRLSYTSTSYTVLTTTFTGYFAAGDSVALCAFSSIANSLISQTAFGLGLFVTCVARSA